MHVQLLACFLLRTMHSHLLYVDQRRICSYFMNGHCKHGDRCRFEHPSSVAQNRLHVGKAADTDTHEFLNVFVSVTSFSMTLTYSTFTGFGRSQKHQGDPYSWRRQPEPPSVRDARAQGSMQLRGLASTSAICGTTVHNQLFCMSTWGVL